VPAVEVTPMATNRLSPEVLEPVRRQLGVAHGVLDVFVAEPRLQCPCVVAGISKRVAATVPQHGGPGVNTHKGRSWGGPGSALHVTFCPGGGQIRAAMSCASAQLQHPRQIESPSRRPISA
jgi:hypothetical protein